MSTEMEIPIMTKIIALTGCGILFFIVAAHEKLLAWLRAGTKHVVKLMLAGGKYMTKIWTRG